MTEFEARKAYDEAFTAYHDAKEAGVCQRDRRPLYREMIRTGRELTATLADAMRIDRELDDAERRASRRVGF